MAVQGFVTYDLALKLYEQVEKLEAKHHLKDQLLRASLSIVLNVAEGSGRPTPADRRRFYGMAYASARETHALLTILKQHEAKSQADRICGMLYRLVHPKPTG